MDLRWNEASGRYNDARTTALYRNHNPRRLETAIGRHAVCLVDYAIAIRRENSKRAGKIVKDDLAAIIAMWTDAVTNGHPIRPETSSLDQWKDEDIDAKFRQRVKEKINEFGQVALSAVRDPNSPPDASLGKIGGVEVYLYLSHRGARDYQKTLRHFEQYVVYLRKLGATPNPDSVEFLEIATAVILCGLNVGAYIDSIL